MIDPKLREIFSAAYRHLESYEDPPRLGDPGEDEWWQHLWAVTEELIRKYDGHPLMRELTVAIYSYLDTKSRGEGK